MKSSKNETEIDDIQPFINVLKDAQNNLKRQEYTLILVFIQTDYMNIKTTKNIKTT